MSQDILISVIMAVYNGCNTLSEAIQSILNQTYQNIELIICDDASTDDTWELLQTWSRKDCRIRLLRNPKNEGAAIARNRCIEQARGGYIAIMDADDRSMPRRLELQLAFLEQNREISFVGSRGEFFFNYLGDLKKNYWFVAAPTKRDFLMTLPFVHASLMFRAEVLWALGGYSDSKVVKRSEDYDLLLRAYVAGYCGVNLADVLYAIRLDETTYHRRKYRYRLNECVVKWRGFSALGLMPNGIPYALKPLLVGLVPVKLLNWLKEKYYGQ